MLLYHGTRKNNPSVIYEGINQGLDVRLSAEGMWGKGIFLQKMLIIHIVHINTLCLTVSINYLLLKCLLAILLIHQVIKNY